MSGRGSHPAACWSLIRQPFSTNEGKEIPKMRLSRREEIHPLGGAHLRSVETTHRSMDQLAGPQGRSARPISLVRRQKSSSWHHEEVSEGLDSPTTYPRKTEVTIGAPIFQLDVVGSNLCFLPPTPCDATHLTTFHFTASCSLVAACM